MNDQEIIEGLSERVAESKVGGCGGWGISERIDLG